MVVTSHYVNLWMKETDCTHTRRHTQDRPDTNSQPKCHLAVESLPCLEFVSHSLVQVHLTQLLPSILEAGVGVHGDYGRLGVLLIGVALLWTVCVRPRCGN